MPVPETNDSPDGSYNHFHATTGGDVAAYTRWLMEGGANGNLPADSAVGRTITALPMDAIMTSLPPMPDVGVQPDLLDLTPQQ